MSSDDRRQRVNALFDKALELPAAERDALIDACTDEDTRAQVRRLLASADEPGDLISTGAPLESPLTEAAGLRPEAMPTARLDSPFSPGRVVAERYRLDLHVGSGGMGAVFRARDLKLDRDVAVKLVGNPGLDASWRERLLREARTAAALNHPNVVAIHDVGEEQGVAFLVMEFVGGHTVEERPPGDLDQVRRTALQVCEALDHAHQRGIVHRDLKPANLLAVLDESGATVIKLADLGIALAGGDSRLTGDGKMLGTPAYMAPEQAMGGVIDARTDLYALGVMLYQWCTNKLPFVADNPMGMISQHVHAPLVPPRELRPELPPALDALICRLLSKEASGRPATARDAQRELASAFGEANAVNGTEGNAPVAAALARPAPPPPKPRTRLIGRTSEREAIRQLIVDQNVRLVTLTGPGGTGKTRLAQQVAEDLADHFRGRVYFVPLAAISDPELVAPAIAQVLGIQSAGSVTDAVACELAGAATPALLILDNLEQVMGAAPLIGELMTAAPSLTALVTSRELLRLYAEYDIPVQPLEVPRPDALPALEELERSPAVALFCERARAANPRFRLDASNAATIVELCARLDGLPLALELAAARARMLSPQAMLARLDSRLGLLTKGARDLPGRQRTLRGTLDWSFDLIEGDERQLFCKLGVFVGGFTLEAAEAVGDTYGKLQLDVVDGVTSLADKSLLVSVESDSDEPRFGMLETIREYALDKLTGDDEREARKAHAAYYLVLAEEGGAELAGGEKAGMLQTFAREHDNYRAALEWLTAHDEAEWGLRLALALFHFWERAEHLSEGRRRIGALLELEAAGEFGQLRARASFSSGVLASAQGDYDEATRLQTQSLDLNRELGDDRGVAVSLNALGVNLTAAGEHDQAQAYLEKSLGVWERLGDDVGYARSLSNLAFVAKLGDRFDEARAMYAKATTLFEAAGDRVGAAWAINHQADVTHEQGDLEAARELYCRGLGVFRKLDDRWGIATCQADIGHIVERQGDVPRAIGLYREALRSFALLDHKRGMARLLESLACSASVQGHARHGLTLAAVATTLRARIGAPAQPGGHSAFDIHVERMRRSLGPEAAGATWTEGTKLRLEQAVRLALDADS